MLQKASLRQKMEMANVILYHSGCVNTVMPEDPDAGNGAEGVGGI